MLSDIKLYTNCAIFGAVFGYTRVLNRRSCIFTISPLGTAFHIHHEGVEAVYNGYHDMRILFPVSNTILRGGSGIARKLSRISYINSELARPKGFHSITISIVHSHFVSYNLLLHSLYRDRVTLLSLLSHSLPGHSPPPTSTAQSSRCSSPRSSLSSLSLPALPWLALLTTLSSPSALAGSLPARL